MKRTAPDEAWRRRCWITAAALVATGSITRALITQTNDMALMVLLVWGGALCCFEDQLPQLRPRPTDASALAGGALLIWSQAQLEQLQQPLPIMIWLPLLQGAGLLLLLAPPRRWRFGPEPLLALALLPLQAALQVLMPVEALSRITALLCQLLLLSLGQDAAVNGNQLILSGGAVTVNGACSGAGMVAQLVVVGGIFSLVFPLTGERRRWPVMGAVMVVAGLFAVLANTLRITWLALINASTWPQRLQWFEFFHGGHGGLVFALMAVMLFAPTYFHLQDRLLERQPR